MLRKLRIALAIIMITLVTLLFVGTSCHIYQWAGWAAKIQFLPALLAFNLVVLAVLIVLTLLFGRIYCSVICPLGIMQDFFSWLGDKMKKNRFSYRKEHKVLRYCALIIFFLCLCLSFAPITTLFEPYSAYGRIVSSIAHPLVNVTVTLVGLLSLLALAFMAWRDGRAYCNSICPVGTILGLFSRFALVKVCIDKDKCKNCGLCEKNCKAKAIDFKAGKIDYSRCVVCGDCLVRCKSDALHYTVQKDLPLEEPATEPDQGRRSFLIGAAMATTTAALAQAQMKVDGGLAVIEDKKAPQRKTPITPPGTSARRLQRFCTACQLCISNCPNHVLRPSTDLAHFMLPTLSFENGHCRPECTRCSQICPTGAITPISRERKTAIHIGHAVWVKENCLTLTEGVNCGNCARHCPAEAIQMVDYEGPKGTVQVPAVDENKCIGCGACEHLCPARPFSAIYVEGYEREHVD